MSSAEAVPAVYRKLHPSNFDFHRPPTVEAIPLTLLHPIFARFAENAAKNKPSKEDIQVVQELYYVQQSR